MTEIVPNKEYDVETDLYVNQRFIYNLRMQEHDLKCLILSIVIDCFRMVLIYLAADVLTTIGIWQVLTWYITDTEHAQNQNHNQNFRMYEYIHND